MKVSEYIKQKTRFEFSKLCFNSPKEMEPYLQKLKKIFEKCKLPNTNKIKNYDYIDETDLFYYSAPYYVDINLIDTKGTIKNYTDDRLFLNVFYIEKDNKVIDCIKDINSLKNKKLKQNKLLFLKDFNENIWRQVTGVTKKYDKDFNSYFQVNYLKWSNNHFEIFAINLLNDLFRKSIKIVENIDNPENEKIKKYLFEKIDDETSLKE